MIELPRRPEWHELSACRGTNPSVFFPTRGQDVQPARTICARCPVAAECLSWAIETGEKLGIYGGLSEKQRRAERRRRRPNRRPAITQCTYPGCTNRPRYRGGRCRRHRITTDGAQT